MIPEIVPVLDLAGGCAVHARGGDRAHYAPVRSTLIEAPGDAVGLTQAYRSAIGARQIYVADLDALTGRAPQLHLLKEIIAAFGGNVLIDAGVSTVAAAEQIRSLNATVVVGLETLESFGALAAIVAAGPGCFSLDLRDGRLVSQASLAHALPYASAVTVAAAAIGAGVSEILVLDLARVGKAVGPDTTVLAELRAVFPGVRLLSGGGVRNQVDLAALGAAGCNAALVGTALHDGRIGRA